MNNLLKALVPVAVAGGLVGSTDADDHIKVNKFLGWEKTTVTRTQQGIVYTPQKFLYKDACGNCCEGIGLAPHAAEIITGRCTTLRWNARDSIPGRTIGLLEGISNEIGKAFSPRTATARPCYPYDRCSEMFIAPVPNYNNGAPAPGPSGYGPSPRLAPIPAR